MGKRTLRVASIQLGVRDADKQSNLDHAADLISKVKDADKIDYLFPLAIVFGSEDRGMHLLVEKSCDFLVRIKMYGVMQSLNVATSSGIFLYSLRKSRVSAGKEEQ